MKDPARRVKDLVSGGRDKVRHRAELNESLTSFQSRLDEVSRQHQDRAIVDDTTPKRGRGRPRKDGSIMNLLAGVNGSVNTGDKRGYDAMDADGEGEDDEDGDVDSATEQLALESRARQRRRLNGPPSGVTTLPNPSTLYNSAGAPAASSDPEVAAALTLAETLKVVGQQLVTAIETRNNQHRETNNRLNQVERKLEEANQRSLTQGNMLNDLFGILQARSGGVGVGVGYEGQVGGGS
jgi:hypothetical protein